MWGRDYYETTSRMNRDKVVQRSISLEGPEAQSGQNDVIAPIGVRGVFLQRGGISQPSMLLACFNSAGGANAGL